MKKLLCLVLSTILALSAIACGTKNSSENAASSNNQSTTTASKKLVMCTNAEFPPYEYHDGSNIIGIDIDIIKKIGEMKGFEVEIMDIAFDACIPAVMNSKADFAMSGMTVTEDRKENVDFTHTYQTAIQNVIVPSDSTIKNIEDLKGKKIGVIEGYTGDLYATEDFGEEYISRYHKNTDGFQSLKSGRIDAFIIDDQVAKALVAEDGGDYKILDSAYALEEYAIAVKKGNKEILDMLNSAIDEMKSNGELQKIIDKYIE
ncbi:MAG: amino acid ABC transporter substrate-binding protein [Lachnospiraceae bacterium]|nr:amino acid ABC transporter substrate-binding protein [Lachnospiraceae bacterium]